MRASTSASHALGSTPLSFAVYAVRRTMPSGSGGNSPFQRFFEASKGFRSDSIRHSLAIRALPGRQARRMMHRRATGYRPCCQALFLDCGSFSYPFSPSLLEEPWRDSASLFRGSLLKALHFGPSYGCTLVMSFEIVVCGHHGKPDQNAD